MLNDMTVIDRRLERLGSTKMRGTPEERKQMADEEALLTRLMAALEEETPLRDLADYQRRRTQDARRLRGYSRSNRSYAWSTAAMMTRSRPLMGCWARRHFFCVGVWKQRSRRWTKRKQLSFWQISASKNRGSTVQSATVIACSGCKASSPSAEDEVRCMDDAARLYCTGGSRCDPQRSARRALSAPKLSPSTISWPPVR